MALPGPRDHTITVETAAEMTKRHRDNFIKGGFFWKDQVLEMLGGNDSVGMRYYYGLDENAKQVLILTAVDEQGNDLYDQTLLELAFPCPEICSEANPLNSD